MNYRETLEYLYRLRLFGTKLGLKNIARLASELGSPQDRLRFIHVAGTNGKGSVCAFLDRIYREEGYKVGLFTSPHLVRFAERLQIQGKPIPDDRLVSLVATIRNTLENLPEGSLPTFFEFLTGMALQYFVEENCDIVIWESGMGGRLDATNIVSPECSVITNVSMDHQAWLGDSVRMIAREKAGIIKPGKPIVTATTHPDALEEIQLQSTRTESPLYLINPEQLSGTMDPGLKGVHQKINAAIARKVVELLEPQLPIPEASLEKALRQTTLPGRFQEIVWQNRKIILDVAHNLAGYEALADNCRNTFQGIQCELIFASLDDKPWKEGLELLLPHCESVHCVPANSQRTASPLDLKHFLEHSEGAPKGLNINAHASFEACMNSLSKDSRSPVLIAGSFYLVGDSLAFLQQGDHQETALNEWGAKL